MESIIKYIDIEIDSDICKSADDSAPAQGLRAMPSGKYMPEIVRKYIDDNRNAWTADNDSIYLLVVALSAGEYWGPNTRGDYFPELALTGLQDEWEAKTYNPDGEKENRVPRYKTFEWAKVYRWHRTDKDNEIGSIVRAFWDDNMKRVLCIVRIDKSKAPDVVDMLSSGTRPAFSMGLKEPYDFCLDPSMPVLTGKGWARICDISEGDSVMTHRGNFANVMQVMTSRPEECVKISTEILPDMVVTPNHMVLVKCDGAIIKRPASQLTTDDRLVVPLFVSCEDTLSSKDVMSYFMNNTDCDCTVKEGVLGFAIRKLLSDGWTHCGTWMSSGVKNTNDAMGLFHAFWAMGIPCKLLDDSIYIYIAGLVWHLCFNVDYYINSGDIADLDVIFDGSNIYPRVTGISRSTTDKTFYNVSLDADNTYTSLYAVGNCSICDNKRMPNEAGCEHTRYNLNGIDEKTGKKVYYINRKFFFRDLSVVGQNPADKTAWGLLKVASDESAKMENTGTTLPSSDIKKESPIITNVEPIKVPSGTSTILIKITRISGFDKSMPDSILDELSKFLPDQVFSGLSRSGITMNPLEYYKYRQMGGLPLSTPDFQPSNASIGRVMDVLKRFIPGRSAISEHLGNRLAVIMPTIKNEPYNSPPVAEKTGADYIKYRDSVNHILKNSAAYTSLLPAAAFFAPYMLSAYYKRKYMEGYPLNFTSRSIMNHPLALGLLSAAGTSAALKNLGGFAKAIQKFSCDDDLLIYNLIEEAHLTITGNGGYDEQKV